MNSELYNHKCAENIFFIYLRSKSKTVISSCHKMKIRLELLRK